MDEKNVKQIKLSLILLGISILLFIIIKCLTGFTDKDKLEKKLGNLGDLYYQTILYPTIADSENDFATLKVFEQTGFRVTLSNMLTSTNTDKEIFKLKGKECDLEESYIILYPQDPYEKKDFKLESNLICN